MQEKGNVHYLENYKKYLKLLWFKVTRHKFVAIVALISFSFYIFLQVSNEAITFKENVDKIFPETAILAELNKSDLHKDDIIDNSDTVCEECENIYQAALTNLDNYFLTSPVNNNAYEKYLKLKKLNSDLSNDLQEKIMEKYKILIKSSVNKEKLISARTLLKRLRTVDSSGNYRELDILISQKEKEKKAKIIQETDNSNRNNNLNKNTFPDIQDDPEATGVNIEWISGVCLAMGSALGDSTKLDILKVSLLQADYLSTKDLYQLYTCIGLYGDSNKITAIETLVSKVKKGYLKKEEFVAVVESLLSDSSKSKSTELLIPLLKIK